MLMVLPAKGGQPLKLLGVTASLPALETRRGAFFAAAVAGGFISAREPGLGTGLTRTLPSHAPCL